MLFNSFNFWIVFPFIFAVYWIIPVKYTSAKKWFLILASYLLYMNFKPAYALILLGITVVTYVVALYLESPITSAHIKRRRIIVWTGVVLAALPLIVFKYYNFINESIFSAMEAIGIRLNMPGLNWAVPVGISFFTFQALGYMLDVYFRKIRAERSFSDYLLFCSFFPQTASGPISKASELLPQIKAPNAFKYERVREGLHILLWGMFLKVVFADRLGLYVDTVYGNVEHYSGITCLVGGAIHGALQILEKFFGFDPKGKYGHWGNQNVVVKVTRIGVTFSLVTLAWIFFRSQSIDSAMMIIGKIFTNEAGLWQPISFVPVVIVMFMMVVGREVMEEFCQGHYSLLNSRFTMVRWCSYLFLFAFIILYGVLDSTQFIYVSF